MKNEIIDYLFIADLNHVKKLGDKFFLDARYESIVKAMKGYKKNLCFEVFDNKVEFNYCKVGLRAVSYFYTIEFDIEYFKDHLLRHIVENNGEKIHDELDLKVGKNEYFKTELISDYVVFEG